jgi:glycerol-3-phosphate dehydrogenase
LAAESPFSHQSRAAALAAMADGSVDLLIIGGGITGAGIARDAAMRGIRTALIDKADFGAGTSSNSSRLIHGGIRYLEQYAFHLVFEASHERRVLLQIAPHLVKPLAFLFPIYSGSRVAAWKIRAGMWLYDMLSLFRNVKSHRWLRAKKVRRVEPGLRDRGLVGAAIYYDAQVDDARLVLATMRSAARAKALVANYVEVTSLLKPDGRVRGAVVRDVLSGETITIRASVIVNATGPWSDSIRLLDDPHAIPLLRPTKGAHVVVARKRIANQHAVTLFSPIDGRVMFVLPWGNDFSYVGTTDTDADGSPDALRVTSADVTYLLRSANAAFPSAHLTPKDVISAWAGLRPLLDQDNKANPSAVSREHHIDESPHGLISIAGGKLTTYRIMARDVVDRVSKRLHELDGRAQPKRSPTGREPLPGGETADLNVLIEAARARGASAETAEHLVAYYGSEAAAVLNLVDRDRALGEPIAAGHPEIWAEVTYAIEREMALRLQDVLIRRLHLFYESRDQAREAVPGVASRMKKLLGWDDSREAEELRDYFMVVERTQAFRRTSKA